MNPKTAVIPFSKLGKSWLAQDHVRHEGMKLAQWERLQDIARIRSKYRVRIDKLDAEERELRLEIEATNLV